MKHTNFDLSVATAANTTAPPDCTSADSHATTAMRIFLTSSRPAHLQQPTAALKLPSKLQTRLNEQRVAQLAEPLLPSSDGLRVLPTYRNDAALEGVRRHLHHVIVGIGNPRNKSNNRIATAYIDSGHTGNLPLVTQSWLDSIPTSSRTALKEPTSPFVQGLGESLVKLVGTTTISLHVAYKIRDVETHASVLLEVNVIEAPAIKIRYGLLVDILLPVVHTVQGIFAKITQVRTANGDSDDCKSILPTSLVSARNNDEHELINGSIDDDPDSDFINSSPSAPTFDAASSGDLRQFLNANVHIGLQHAHSGVILWERQPAPITGTALLAAETTPSAPSSATSATAPSRHYVPPTIPGIEPEPTQTTASTASTSESFAALTLSTRLALLGIKPARIIAGVRSAAPSSAPSTVKRAIHNVERQKLIDRLTTSRLPLRRAISSATATLPHNYASEPAQWCGSYGQALPSVRPHVVEPYTGFMAALAASSATSQPTPSSTSSTPTPASTSTSPSSTSSAAASPSPTPSTTSSSSTASTIKTHNKMRPPSPQPQRRSSTPNQLTVKRQQALSRQPSLSSKHLQSSIDSSPPGMTLLTSSAAPATVAPHAKPILPANASYDERRAFILANKDDTSLPDWANDELIDVLARYPKLFSPLDDTPAKIPYHCTIKPGVAPVRSRVRRIHPSIYPAFKQELDTMIKAGVLIPAPANIPWASPIVVVPKRPTATGQHTGVRICGDFTARNAGTTVPEYEHPTVENLLNSLGTFSYASTLDLTMGYSQVEIPPEMRASTTIITPEGRFMFKRLPQGLAESAAIFSSGVADVLMHLINAGTVLQYVDDLAIVTRAYKSGDPRAIREHIKDIDATLKKLSEANIRVNLLKSSFLSTSISYLGCVVSNGKRSIDPARLQGLTNLEEPRNLREAESFGGLANYHSQFVKGLATTLGPLNDYIASERRGRTTNKRYSTAPPPAAVDAYYKAKTDILNATALSQPNPTRPYVIQSDASDIGMGTCLLQADDEGILRPVAYASQKWTPTQSRYSVTDREMLGVALAFKRWPQLLQHAPDILVQSDHQNLAKWSDSVSLRVARLALFLSRFRIRFAWLKGSDNTLADVLSRLRPEPAPEQGTISALIASDEPTATSTVADDTPASPQAVSSLIVGPSIYSNSATHSHFGAQFDASDTIDGTAASAIQATRDVSIGLATCHTSEQHFCLLASLQQDDVCPADSITLPDSADTSLLRRIALAQLHAPAERKRLADANIIQASSRRNVDIDEFSSNKAIWIPSEAKEVITELLVTAHDNCAHSGISKTLHRLREANVQWVNMESTIRNYISSCSACTHALSKPSKFKHGRLGSYLDSASAPGHLLVADYAGPFPASSAIDTDGKPVQARYTLTLVDWYSRHAQIYATEKADAATTVDCLNRYCNAYGRPLRFKSDRGSHFVNESVINFLRDKSIIADFSLAYRPESQGVVERLHSPLVRAMRAHTGLNNSAWAKEIARIQWSINTAYNSSIGTSPFTVFFGRQPNTELSNALGSPIASFATYDARQLEADQWITYVREFLERAHVRNQTKHDADHTSPTFNTGDTVSIWQPPGSKSNKLARSIRTGIIISSDTDNDNVYDVVSTFSTPNSNDKLQASTKYHADRLHRIPAQRPISDSEMAAEHNDMLLRGLGTVEHIIESRLHQSKKHHEFLVKWAHVSPADPQWTAGHTISRSAKLAEFCAARNFNLETATSSALPPVPIIRGRQQQRPQQPIQPSASPSPAPIQAPATSSFEKEGAAPPQAPERLIASTSPTSPPTVAPTITAATTASKLKSRFKATSEPFEPTSASAASAAPPAGPRRGRQPAKPSLAPSTAVAAPSTSPRRSTRLRSATSAP